MSEIAVGMTTSAGVVLTVLTHLTKGRVDEAIALFAEEFRFHDYGIGLEFKEKERLAEFFCKNRELYQTPSYRLTLFFCVVIVWLPNGRFEPHWSSLFTAGSHARFQSRCMALPSCGQRTGRLRNGRTTTTE